MKFSRFLIAWPVACLLAQTPASQPRTAPDPQSSQPAQAKPAADPAKDVTVELSSENVAEKPVSVPPDRVVITIGERKITFAEFNQIIDALPEQYRVPARGEGRRQFADNLVRVFLLADEGKRLKLDQSETYKIQVAFQNANALAGRAFEQISANIKVDDAAIRANYDEHKSEYEQVKARHILIRMKGSPLPVKPGQKDLTPEEALARVQELRKKILAGADFAKTAEAESDDTGSATNGGDLGFFGRGQMVPSFEQAAFALKAGELSEPVQSPFGYHLIKLEAKQSKTFEEMKPEIEKRLRPELAQKSLAEIEKKANVVLDQELFGGAAK